ncbi:MAG TPA: hypothetical protein VLJ76_06545 [Gaiellaceae bacterium]|nr:hypothetical protein [Gaiellaceae bacterium]
MAGKDERDRQRDDVDLDAETVRDLEPDEKESDNVRGGSIIACQVRGKETTGGATGRTQ